MLVDEHTVLIIDRDGAFRETLSEHLIDLGDFEVFEAPSGISGMARTTRETHDAILVSDRLPDFDAADLCRSLRARGITCPLIVMGTPSCDESVIRALDAGASDVVRRTSSPAVLTARIRAHLRQWDRSEAATLRFGPYAFDQVKRALRREDGGDAIRLTGKEAAILKRLHRSRGETVRREELLREVWGYRCALRTHTLETHVYRLRRKIEPAGSDPEYLLSRPGGYLLNAS